MMRLLKRLASMLSLAFEIMLIKLRYMRHVWRIRRQDKRTKIRVLFIVSEVAKWKEQCLYEAMHKSGVFEPIVGLSAWNAQSEAMCSNEKLIEIHNKAEAYFARLGDSTVRTVNVVNGIRVISDLSEFNPDIVYYTEPWGPAKGQDPINVSRFALTCYSPYYVPNYSIIEQECKLPLHRWLWEYYCLGSWQAECFADAYHPFSLTTKFIGAGHPALDPFYLRRGHEVADNMVIYAPHCTISGDGSIWPQHYATFRWSGKFMLEYAKLHPEVKWVFKPHPMLKVGIRAVGLMSDDEIEAYYAEWRNIAFVCEDSDYQNLFLSSRAMITDCGSFLSEYGATGHPIIHLISSDNIRMPISKLANLYNTYYKAHDIVEFKEMLKMVVEEYNDPMAGERMEELKATGLGSVNASENIINHLKVVLRR